MTSVGFFARVEAGEVDGAEEGAFPAGIWPLEDALDAAGLEVGDAPAGAGEPAADADGAGAFGLGPALEAGSGLEAGVVEEASEVRKAADSCPSEEFLTIEAAAPDTDSDAEDIKDGAGAEDDGGAAFVVVGVSPGGGDAAVICESAAGFAVAFPRSARGR